MAPQQLFESEYWKADITLVDFGQLMWGSESPLLVSFSNGVGGGNYIMLTTNSVDLFFLYNAPPGKHMSFPTQLLTGFPSHPGDWDIGIVEWKHELKLFFFTKNPFNDTVVVN